MPCFHSFFDSHHLIKISDVNMWAESLNPQKNVFFVSSKGGGGTNIDKFCI